MWLSHKIKQNSVSNLWALQCMFTSVRVGNHSGTNVCVCVSGSPLVPHDWLFTDLVAGSSVHLSAATLCYSSGHQGNPAGTMKGEGLMGIAARGRAVTGCWVPHVLVRFSLSFANHILLGWSRLNCWDFWSVILPEALANTWCSGAEPRSDSVLCCRNILPNSLSSHPAIAAHPRLQPMVGWNLWPPGCLVVSRPWLELAAGAVVRGADPWRWDSREKLSAVRRRKVGWEGGFGVCAAGCGWCRPVTETTPAAAGGQSSAWVTLHLWDELQPVLSPTLPI